MLYRIWDKKNKQMHYKNYLIDEEKNIYDKNLKKQIKTNYKIMFSTNIKDKNNKLIYEKDILNYNNLHFEVRKNNNDQWILYNLTTKNNTIYLHEHNKRMEIIGNTLETKQW